MASRLFPLDLPEREFVEFSAEGFSAPVSGVIYSGENPPDCGMPLGGVGTGCLDLEADGRLGFCTLFNSLLPRRGPLGVTDCTTAPPSSPPPGSGPRPGSTAGCRPAYARPAGRGSG